MSAVIITLSVAVLLWGVYGLALFTTHVIAVKDEAADFKPFKSALSMITAGVCLWILFFVGAFTIINSWGESSKKLVKKYELIHEPIYREVK